MKKTVLLAILDGLGEGADTNGNAFTQANTPNIDNLKKVYPNTEIRADGEYVGLPIGQMGNSEVGHTNLGAGRIIYQSLTRINKDITDGNFFENKVLIDAVKNANNNSLHIIGLVSDGGVHSHIKHIEAMIQMANSNGVKKIYIHAITDGRDVDPKSAVQYIQELSSIAEENNAQIISISGRYYAMDRDKRWERVKLAYDAIVSHNGEKYDNIEEYIKNQYEEGITDEFIVPAVINDCDVKINDNDSVIFMNFRPDRAIQLSSVLTNPDYNPTIDNPVFVPEYRPKNLNFVQLMHYSDTVIGNVAYGPMEHKNILGEVVANHGLKQLRIAETEKYPHVTFFFDNGNEEGFENEDKILIPSPKVATYDLKPEMSAYEITDTLVEKINDKEYDMIILNYANPDMVGHSGDIEATKKAVEVVDECIGKVVNALNENNGVAIIIADHGNAECVLNEDGSPNTAHTTNPVMCIVTDETRKIKNGGSLQDIAPTILDLLGLEKPSDMTGVSMLIGEDNV